MIEEPYALDRFDESLVLLATVPDGCIGGIFGYERDGAGAGTLSVDGPVATLTLTGVYDAQFWRERLTLTATFAMPLAPGSTATAAAVTRRHARKDRDARFEATTAPGAMAVTIEDVDVAAGLVRGSFSGTLPPIPGTFTLGSGTFHVRVAVSGAP